MIYSIRKAACSALLLCLSTLTFAQDPAPDTAAKPKRVATLNDLYAEQTLVDTAISLNGRYVAAIARLEKEKADLLVTFDLETGERKVVQRVGFDQAGKGLVLYMASVEWKTDDKMLVRLRIRPQDELNFFTVSETKIAKLGDRLAAVDRTTGKSVGLLADNRNAALEGAFNLGEVRSLLPQDPQHILMELDGFNGRSLFKVNIETGHGELLERPQESIVGWWLDVSGKPVVRMSVTNGTIKLFRKDDGDKWRLFHKMRMQEMESKEEYQPVGASDNPDKYYVLAAPEGHDRIGLYLYDLKNESFGEPVVENPQYDIDSARISRDGTKVLRYCYLAHVRICEFTDAKINAHMRGLRKYFEESANVYVHDASEDGNGIVLFVEGPGDPPSYYYYQKEKKDIRSLGGVRKGLNEVAHPTAAVVSWTSRDGKPLSGYLTLPPGVPASSAAKLPLVVHPHGGPEARDHLTFHPWVQYFAARGYAVFQPNFRGSAGFGRAYVESGYGEWGRKMQDDITDGIKMLVEKGAADPSRLCIVGASYGGYAALAGAALTPDLYKCAVSVAGVSDLDDFIGWRRRNWGSDSEGYMYWLKAIGDPDKDAQKLREVSPVSLADKIKVPVLLIHGTDDFVVPIAQSRAMKKALEKNGKKTELLELEKEGHSYWQDFNEVKVLASIDNFLWKNLGPGHGVTTPPPAAVASK